MNRFSKIYNKIFDFTLEKTTPLKFSHLINTTKKISNPDTMIKLSTSHLYKEMPIRFAHRIKDLNMFPFGLNHNHNVNIIRDWYLTSFEELISKPEPKTPQEMEQFKTQIEKIYLRHSPTILTLTRGLFELKESGLIIETDDKQIQIFLDKFHSSRTEIRILIEHYLSLFATNNINCTNGKIINYNTNINDVVDKVVLNINLICERANYKIDFEDIVKIKGNGTLSIIDNYLYYILFELIKNSTQAVITSNKKDKLIQINITDLEDYINIKITDNGTGIREEDLEKIWLYSYSTNPIEPQKIIEQEDFSINSPLSGFGYGLPISKIYLNFFSSIICIDSEYGKGTQVNLFIKKFN